MLKTERWSCATDWICVQLGWYLHLYDDGHDLHCQCLRHHARMAPDYRLAWRNAADVKGGGNGLGRDLRCLRRNRHHHRRSSSGRPAADVRRLSLHVDDQRRLQHGRQLRRNRGRLQDLRRVRSRRRTCRISPRPRDADRCPPLNSDRAFNPSQAPHFLIWKPEPMRIVDIRELSVPLEGNIANAVVSFAEHDVSLVAVVTDVVRNGKPVVGYAFDSIGRFAQGGILRDRMIPRLEAAAPGALLDEGGSRFDVAKVFATIMRDEKPGG